MDLECHCLFFLRLWKRWGEENIMDKLFCNKCGDISPKCAIYDIPQNIKIDNLVNQIGLSDQECLVCHANAQILDNKLIIGDKCDECYLCQFACPEYECDFEDEKALKLEKIIIIDFVKLAILIKSMFPQYMVGTEVHVKGNSRTKRIDVVIVTDTRIILVKVLSNVDKIPLYSRSYEEVKNYYGESFGREIVEVCLIPEKKKENAEMYEYPFCSLKELIEELGE